MHVGNTTPAGSLATRSAVTGNGDQSESRTISERELWLEFCKHGFAHFDPFTGKPLSVTTPHEALTEPGEHGVLDGRLDRWVEQLEEADDPSGDMEMMRADLENFLDHLKRVQRRFEDLKHVRQSDGEDGGFTPRPANWPDSSELARITL